MDLILSRLSSLIPVPQLRTQILRSLKIALLEREAELMDGRFGFFCRRKRKTTQEE